MSGEFEPIVRAESQSGDDDFSLRPKFLADFIGQKEIKENLHTFIVAAKARGDALDHLLLSGPPGLGKTTLAQIVAAELGADFKATSAPALEKPKDLVGILSTLQEGSVFFIDEIHRLRPVLEEELYGAMEDFSIDFIIGQGPAARNVKVPIPHFTLVGATTKPGMISSPLVSRFGIQERFSFYSPEDLARVVRRSAMILGAQIDDDAALLIGSCSRGTPRVANRILRRMRDFAQVKNKTGRITKGIVDFGLEKLQIDFLGLERHDREILAAIIEKFSGGPVGAETLAISIGESADTLEDYFEPYLIQLGFLQRTPRGRIATEKAYAHLGFSAQRRDSLF